MHRAVPVVFLAGFALLGASGEAPAKITYTIVHKFNGTPHDGGLPVGAVAEDGSGTYWGTTSSGGSLGHGVVFTIAGGKYSVVHDFADGTDGASPFGALLVDKAGNVWGTTVGGGAVYGTIFEISGKAYSVVYRFLGGSDGANPDGGLMEDASGNYWGTTQSGGAHDMGTLYKLAGGGHSVVHDFAGAPDDGSMPSGTVIEDGKGNLWGTTTAGGSLGGGTIYKISASGTYSIVHNFGADGTNPNGGLIEDQQGNLWGTTAAGGTNAHGIVFKIGTRGKYAVAHNFRSGKDGAAPAAPLAKDAQGYLWGTTAQGAPSGHGTIFRISPKGAYAVMHRYAKAASGYDPQAPLFTDLDDHLWGTTRLGGAAKNVTFCPEGCGTLFEIVP